MTDSEERRRIPCPRCKATTQVVKLSALEIDRCEACGGVWFDIGEIKQLRALSNDRGIRDEIGAALVAGKSPLATGQVVALACPLCALKMTRRPHEDAPGVVIDRCQQHGTWLDRGEALRLLEMAKKTDEARSRALAEQHEPRKRGWLSAVLDLFD